MRWSDVNANQTVLHTDVRAIQWSYPARSYVSVALTARMMKTRDITFASDSDDDSEDDGDV